MFPILKTVDRLLGQVLRWFCIADMIALIFILSGVVFIRFVPIAKLSWSDEVIEWLMAALVFLASAELWRENDHFKITMIADRLAGRPSGRIFTLGLEILTALFILCFASSSLDMTLSACRTSPILSWPMSWWYAPMPIAGFIMVAYSIRNIVQGFRAVREGFKSKGTIGTDNKADGTIP